MAVQTDQIVNEAALAELSTSARASLDAILAKVNALGLVPGKVTTNGTNVLTIASTTQTWPDGRGKGFPLLNGVDVSGLSGSYTLNSTGGTGSTDAQSFVYSSFPADQYLRIGLEIRSDKKIYCVQGSPAATAGAATYPAFSGLPLALVLLHKTSTTLDNVLSANIVQFIGAGTGGGGGATTQVTQASHGLSLGDAVYLNTSVYQKAKADVANTAEVVGIVSRVLDANTFELTVAGKVTGLSGLTAGGVYFLSDTTAGLMTLTEPNVIGEISKPVFIADTTTSGFVMNMRGVVIGSVNARSNAVLANNSITNVQDLSAYDSATIEGHLFVDGTTDTRSFYKIHVIKKGDGTFEIATDRIGDDVGETVSITSAGLLQITLPSVAGFVSANFVYTLGAPQVGATFPLSVSGTNITDQKTVQTYTASGAISSAPSAVQHIFNSASALAMTLGSAVGVNGSRIHLKNVNTGLVTITFNGAETCEGNANITLVQWEFAVLEAFNNNWIIVG